MQSMKRGGASATAGIVLAFAMIRDAGAQAAQNSCSSRPDWQIVAAFLLATRWRRLFGVRRA